MIATTIATMRVTAPIIAIGTMHDAPNRDRDPRDRVQHSRRVLSMRLLSNDRRIRADEGEMFER